VSAGSRPVDNFLFIHTTDADHDAFNRVISWVALFEMVITLGAAWAARQWRETKRDLWNVLLGWAIACCVLMFPVAGVLWKVLPKMEFMQFPWRWLLCLSMIFSIFVTVGLRRWWWRGAVCVVAILVIATAWHRAQTPWWDSADDLREMQDNMAMGPGYQGVGYEGVDEYTPLGADPTAIDKDASNVAVDGTTQAASHIRIDRWDPESRTFTAEMPAPGQLALRLFPYPACRVEVNGQVVETATRAGSGQMLVPVGAGMNRVQITFIRTWDRAAGGWISLIAAFGVIVWFLLAWSGRRTSDLRPRPSSSEV